MKKTKPKKATSLKKPKENSSKEHTALLKVIRKKFKTELEMFDDLNTDWTLLRFCKAKNYDQTKVFDMLKSYFEIRKRKDFKRISQMIHSDFKSCSDHLERGYYGVDKQNKPIIILKPGNSDFKALVQNNSKDFIEDFVIYSCEKMIHVIFPFLSDVKGERVDKFIGLIDMSGMSYMDLFDQDILMTIENTIRVSMTLFPELVEKVICVNAPMFYKMMVGILSQWVSKDHLDKIEFHTELPEGVFKEHMDIEQIPTFWGGKNERKIADNYGPWEEVLKDSDERGSFYLKDMKLEHKYFFTKEDKQRALKKK